MGRFPRNETSHPPHRKTTGHRPGVQHHRQPDQAQRGNQSKTGRNGPGDLQALVCGF